MIRHVSRKAFRLALTLLACLPVVSLAIAQKPQSEIRDNPSRFAPLRGVLSRQALKPPIRGRKARIVFSPDGKYVLLQSESGLFLFATQPLKPVLHIEADYLYPVRFSPDSQSLSAVSFALRTARWRVPTGEVVSTGSLSVADGCISGELTLSGESFICRHVDLSIHVYDLNSGHESFGEESRLGILQSVTVPSALPRNNVLPSAVGLALVRNFQIYANEGVYPDRFAFSPDGTLFAVLAPEDNSLWSLSSKRKLSVSGALNKNAGASFCFLDSERVLITGVSRHAEIVSLPSGKLAGELNIASSTAVLASNRRYVIFAAEEGASSQLYDLTENRVVDVPENVAIDVREGVLAVLDPAGRLQLFQVGEQTPFASTPAPLEVSPARFSAAASPNLDLLAFGFGREMGLYRVANGEQVLTLNYSAQESIPNAAAAYFVRPTDDQRAIEIFQAEAEKNTIAPLWQSNSLFIRGNPYVFLEYQLEGENWNVPEISPEGKIRFALKASEPASGKILWEKKFVSASPVPFTDSQGKNLVLAWEAATDAGRQAAKRCPEAWPIFQKTKPARNDTFFEVVDSVSGQTVGGVLVRTGAGPWSFDSVAAVGSTLIISKAGDRVTLYSLDDGEIKAHLNGNLPAANERTQLLALVENDGRLGIYDLRTGKKVATQQIGQPITYVHFSEDGRRLLVLTRQQIVYVLNVSEAAKTSE